MCTETVKTTTTTTNVTLVKNGRTAWGFTDDIANLVRQHPGTILFYRVSTRPRLRASLDRRERVVSAPVCCRSRRPLAVVVGARYIGVC